MNRMLTGVVLCFAAAAAPGCGTTCPEVETADTTTGSYVYGPSSPGQSRGKLASSGLSVSSNGSGGVLVLGSFVDTSGSTRTFELTLTGIVNDASVALASGSQACLDEYTTCVPLAGSVTTGLFTHDCTESNLCALVITGGASVSASFGEDTLAVQLTFDHHESVGEEACPNPPSQDTEGS